MGKPYVVVAFAVIFSGAVLLARPSLAQYIGFGDKSCGTWALERRNQSTAALVYSAWVAGYVSGVNTANVIDNKSPDFLKRTDGAAITAWIDNYCSSYPLSTLLDASIKLINTLRANAGH
jgi:hypothetical protein